MEVTAVVVVVLAMAALGAGAPSIMLPQFSWQDCGNTSSLVRVTRLTMSSPLTIPGTLSIKKLVATINGTLPQDALIQFRVMANSSFGPQSMLTVPCFLSQGGSCAYKVCDMVNLASGLSSVTQQFVTSLMKGGLVVTHSLDSDKCSVGAIQNGITLRDVNIDIPTMLHTPMDSFISTDNYFVTATIITPDQHVLGCLQLNMPVYKPCLGHWLCPQPIDDSIAYISSHP